ncbi:MAG: uroporphyrinogen decarboxylase family protein, partial [Planctomycetota bacterium]
HEVPRMTPRQRLLTALRRGQPDRVPVTMYEYSHHVADWPSRDPSYAPLLDLEARYGDTLVWWPHGFPVFFEPRWFRRTQTTGRDGSVTTTTDVDTPRGPLHAVSRRAPGVMTGWQIEPLVKSDADIDRILSLPDPAVEFDAAAWRALEQRVGEAGLLSLNPGDALGHVAGLFDFQDFVLRCCRDDGPVRALLARAQEHLLRGMRHCGTVVKDAPVRLWGPEYCGPPLMNPRRFFTRYVVEPDRALTELIHATGNFSVIHCHGRLRDLLDHFVEIGADALEPIETLPMPTADVTLAEVKQRIGHRLCLMGAVQARTLECGSPDDMRREVQAALRDAGPGGGFIVLPTSAPFMTPLTPICLANARVIYETVHDCGRYPLFLD